MDGTSPRSNYLPFDIVAKDGPWIGECVVVTAGSNALRVARDNPVNDRGSLPWNIEPDDVSDLRHSVGVGLDLEDVPIGERWMHAWT